MRSFVAIPLPDDTRDALEAAQLRLPLGRLVVRENLHLTLAFLDDQSEEALELLHAELEHLRAPEFTVSLSGLGSFGGDKPRLIFANVLHNPALENLHRKVLNAARRAEIIVARRRFHPHVTLARMRPGAGRGDRIANAIATLNDLLFPATPVSSFSLYRSDLHPDGPIYHELARYDLV
ncbi:RNA 2',3'-cyclic phosphodiesterase [Sedimentitalea todarodis]|uniref:RNA 2',3'-cyclic phosphodiesterase n=1 Tax=Sedimentitalea todarodis TaxID=1631240 RepID=A0ABU3VEP8_9RHOB|nr:RNA 2',3'-cyclic phosphodiesterase [Sedimentitalea todarodis]MDU9004184.1 RNA 2',3'-cyclic phosphodiesterase [Sedimentitalea todarodis]